MKVRGQHISTFSSWGGGQLLPLPPRFLRPCLNPPLSIKKTAPLGLDLRCMRINDMALTEQVVMSSQWSTWSEPSLGRVQSATGSPELPAADPAEHTRQAADSAVHWNCPAVCYPLVCSGPTSVCVPSVPAAGATTDATPCCPPLSLPSPQRSAGGGPRAGLKLEPCGDHGAAWRSLLGSPLPPSAAAGGTVPRCLAII